MHSRRKFRFVLLQYTKHAQACVLLDFHSFAISHVGDGLSVRVDHVVRKVDQKLSEAPFRGGVVSQHRRKGCIAKRLGKALAESFTGPSVVAEPIQSRVSP